MPTSVTYPPSGANALSTCSTRGKAFYQKLQYLDQPGKIFDAIDKYCDFHENLAGQKKTLTALVLMSAPLLSASISSSLSIDITCMTGASMSNIKTCSGAAAIILGTICGFAGTGLAIRGIFDIQGRLKTRINSLDSELQKKLNIPPTLEAYSELNLIGEFTLLPENDRKTIRKQLALDVPDITPDR